MTNLLDIFTLKIYSLKCIVLTLYSKERLSPNQKSNLN
jgi:hypothetical protein